MTVKRTFPLFFAGVVLAGCGPEQSTTVASNRTAPVAGSISGTAKPAIPYAAKPAAPKPTDDPHRIDTRPTKAPTKSEIQAIQKKMAEQMIDQAKRENPKPIITIPPPATNEWIATNVNPVQLASSIGKSIASLKNTTADLFTLSDSPEGHGRNRGVLKVADNKRYNIDFIVLSDVPVPAKMVANGKQRIVKLGEEWIPPMSVSKSLPAAQRDPKKLIDAFNVDYQRLAFQGLTEGSDPWVPLVKQLAAGYEGYQLRTEERHLMVSGRNFLSYRFRATRSAEAAKKYGESTIEIVVDGQRYLPVTIRHVYKDLQGNARKSQWSAQYVFNRSLTDKDFDAPFSMKPPAKTTRA